MDILYRNRWGGGVTLVCTSDKKVGRKVATLTCTYGISSSPSRHSRMAKHTPACPHLDPGTAAQADAGGGRARPHSSACRCCESLCRQSRRPRAWSWTQSVEAQGMDGHERKQR
eukprot:1147322-Pelagomonas_calceolata.AAC.11